MTSSGTAKRIRSSAFPLIGPKSMDALFEAQRQLSLPEASCMYQPGPKCTTCALGITYDSKERLVTTFHVRVRGRTNVTAVAALVGALEMYHPSAAALSRTTACRSRGRSRL